jgi:hypothetical protein
MLVHFDPNSGAIAQITTGGQPFAREGLSAAIVPDDEAPDLAGKSYAVDLASLRAGADGWDLCSLIELPPPPVSVEEVKAARDAELRATDEYIVWDRPMASELRDAWRAYRQALRDLGAAATAAEMLKAWPIRPDGRDTAAMLRRR